MRKFKYVFVVLVYKNIKVLEDFFNSLDFSDSKVVIVNSFYSIESENECKNLANKFYADFISIPNKGYGYGNNVGVKFAMDNYDFDFLIISNSDIKIEDMSFINTIDSQKSAIYAPKIKMLTGKHQNPNIPYLIPLYYFLLNKWVITGKRLFLKGAYVCSRLSRELFLAYVKITNKRYYRIFNPHGSFIIFSKSAVLNLHPIFNDNMFLYNEESYLAMKCRLKQIPVFYVPKINILHYEGASSSNVESTAFKQSADFLLRWIENNFNHKF